MSKLFNFLSKKAQFKRKKLHGSFKWTPCGSNRKYKKCCRNKVENCERILNIMHYQKDNLFINKKLGCEEPVQLSNYEHSELQKKFEFLTK